MRWTINFALLAEKKKTGIYSRRRKNEKTMRFLLDNFFLFSIFVIFLFYFFPWRTRSTYPDRIPVISKHLVSVIIRLVERFLLRVHTHTHICCVSHKERHKTRSNVTYTSDGRFSRATFKNEKLIIRVTFGL